MKKIIIVFGVLCLFLGGVSQQVFADTSTETHEVNQIDEQHDSAEATTKDDTEKRIEKQTAVIDDNQESNQIAGQARDNTEMITITFVLNGGTMDQTTLSISKDSQATEVWNYSPTKPGFGFMKWYKDAELSDPFNPDERVSEDITLYAHYSPIADVTLFSNDMLRALENMYGKDFTEEDLLSLGAFSLVEENPQGGLWYIKDLKGIDQLKNLFYITIPIGHEIPLTDEDLALLKNIKKITKVDFKAVVPDGYEERYSALEEYKSRKLSDPSVVKHYENEVLRVLQHITFDDSDPQSLLQILFSDGFALHDLSFLEKWDNKGKKFIFNFNQPNFKIVS